MSITFTDWQVVARREFAMLFKRADGAEKGEVIARIEKVDDLCSVMEEKMRQPADREARTFRVRKARAEGARPGDKRPRRGWLYRETRGQRP